MSILTVGIPVHNAMPFLPETINSLLRQECHDFNILIIDDGSTDGSSEYLNRLRDRRVRILHQVNRGISSTRNRLLKESGTPWLLCNDADDISYPNRIRFTLEYIRKHPSAGMFYSFAKYHQDNKSFGTCRTTQATPTQLRILTRAGYLLSIWQTTVTLNIEKTRAAGGYRFDLHNEDIDLWWRMALANDIVLIPEITAGVRLHELSDSSRNIAVQSVNTLYIQYLLLSHLWGISPQPYDEIVSKLVCLENRNKLKLRENIRKANIYAGRRNYIRTLIYAINSLIVAPNYFFERAAYELRNKELVVNGVDPKLFAMLSSYLWRESNE